VANQSGCHRPQRGDIESRVQQSYREPSNPRPDHHCFLAPHQPPIRPNGGLPHIGLGIKPDRGSASKWRIYVAMLAAFGVSIDDEACAWRDLIRDWLRPAHCRTAPGSCAPIIGTLPAARTSRSAPAPTPAGTWNSAAPSVGEAPWSSGPVLMSPAVTSLG
jgi:hypothetical protein